MCKLAYKKGFSLVELIVVIAIIAVLVTLSVGGGKMLKLQAEQRLAAGGIKIIVTALELYYADEGNNFPFAADVSYGLTDFEADAVASGETVIVTSGTVLAHTGVPDPAVAYYWSSQALYYFLTRSANSNKIIATLSNRLVTNTDADGLPIVAGVPTGITSVDLLRFVDPWGSSLRYTYISGNSFPVITSAGSDRQFGTGDDISSQ